MTQSRQLTLKERYQISWYLEADYEQKEIAEALNRSASTISREIRRNSRVIDDTVAVFIEVKLKLKFVPEQISVLLKSQLGVKVSAQSIYNYIHHPLEGREELAKYLPRYKVSRRRRNKKTIERKANDNRVFIDQRSEVINNRERIGDLEVDTIVSKDSKGGALILCDRVAKYTWGVLIPDHKPSTINKAILDTLMPIKDRIHSITSDNGFEFRDWEEIAKQLECDYYFCHPYSSWERGTIENTNGIIRRDFPKGTNFSLVDEKEFEFRIVLMNIRPRKSIEFKTPDEVFFNRESFWDMRKRLHW